MEILLTPLMDYYLTSKKSKGCSKNQDYTFEY